MLGTFRRLVAGFTENSTGEEAAHSRNVVAAVIEFLRLLITIEASADEVPIPSRTVVLTAQQLGVLLSYWTKEGNSVVVAAVPSASAAAVELNEVLATEVATVPSATPATAAVSDEIKMEVTGGEVGESNSGVAVVTPSEIVSPDDVDVAVVTKHPILELREYLEVNRSETTDPILDKCNEIISYLETGRDVSEELDIKDEKEALLPPPEGIVAQYASRRVFVPVTGNDERLKLNYWLNPPNYEEELGDMEQIPCDLTELIKTCLPADTNLVADCKRILNLSVSPQSNRERTVTAPCFRTRRIEMEPIGGRMDKKIFGKGECLSCYSVVQL